MSKILIVDDEKDLAELTGELLTLKGYEVELAKSGYEAIEKSKKTSFDLCLLDIRLPDINGVELFLRIKGINPATRAIMTTGFAIEGLIKEAIEGGAYACIHKPFNMERLFKLIEEILESKRKVILIADDVKEVRKEIQALLEDKGDYKICEAENGQEVIERVRERHYNLILLDYGLPDMDGLVIFSRAREIDPEIVVILMLDKPLEALVRDALRMGFYGCITKPIDPDRLLRMLEEALGNGEGG